MKNIKILFIFLLTTYYLLHTTSLARAQSVSLSISPPILEVLIKPGKSITQAYKITNNGEATLVTAKIVELGENGIKDDKTFNPENWINVVSPNFAFNQSYFLPAGAEKQIVLRINPPVETPEQDFYRALIFTTSSPLPPSEFSQTSASITIGSIILIQTSSTGMLTKGASISKFILPSIVDSFGPLTADIEVENTGKTYIRPVGNITLTGPIGKGSYKIIPEVILAGANKKITSGITNRSDRTLSLSGFYLGKYKLGVEFTLDEGTIKIEQTKTFYAVPWKAGIILSLVILSLVILY